MRTQRRRRTAVVIALLACAAVSVLWVAISMGPLQGAGIALDGSGSGSVNSGSVGSGSVGSDSAQSGSKGSGSAGSSTSRSGSTGSDSTGSGSNGSSSTGFGSDGSGSSGSGSTGSSSTGSGSNGSGSDASSGSGTNGPDQGSKPASGSNPEKPGSGETDPPVHADGLSVTVGTVGTLYPGARSLAPVTIVNQRRGGLAVTDIRVTSAGAAGCGPRYLVMEKRSLHQPLLVPGYGGHVNTKVRFGLRAGAPDSCKGKTLPFSVSVQAVSR